MKLAIVGSGTAGLLLSILLKSKDRSLDILVIEKTNKIAKKVYATGNGKCNVGNLNILPSSYNHEVAFDLLKKYPIDVQREFYSSLGLMTKCLGSLVYPYSENSKTFVDELIQRARNVGVKFISDVKVDDYYLEDGKVVLVTNDKEKPVTYDKVFFAVGGCSSQVYGSDGNLIHILKDRKYDLTYNRPGLCALKTFDSVKVISGQRMKARVTLIDKNGNVHYNEKGEVIFKDEGLGGIAIMNCSSIIARSLLEPKDFYVSLDLTEDIDENLFKNIKSDKQLDSLFTKEVSGYLSHHLKETNSSLKDVKFRIKDFYGFRESQVTVGGIKLSNLTPSFESKIEPNVYFLGEVLDLDGLCGGYNIMLCVAEAMWVSDNF